MTQPHRGHNLTVQAQNPLMTYSLPHVLLRLEKNAHSGWQLSNQRRKWRGKEPGDKLIYWHALLCSVSSVYHFKHVISSTKKAIRRGTRRYDMRKKCLPKQEVSQN